MDGDWLALISPHVHHTGHLPFAKGVINPLRVIYDHELFMFSSGESLLVFGSEEYPCRKNSYLIIPPGREHISYALTDEIHIHWTHFDWVYRPQSARGQQMSFKPGTTQRRRIRRAPAFVPPGVLHGSVESVRAFDLHVRLCEEWATHDARRQSVSRALLMGVLLELLTPRTEGLEETMRAAHLAERAREYLTELANRPFAEMVNLKRGLRDLGRSYYHLERVFRHHYGISPLEYVCALRVERAKTLLREPGTTIAEVARALGFDDPAYFSRFFRARAGRAPRAFRRAEGVEA